MNRSTHVNVLAAAAIAIGAIAANSNAAYTAIPMSWTTVHSASLTTSFGPGGGAGGGIPNSFIGVSPSSSPEYAYAYGHGAGGFDSYEFAFDPSTWIASDSGAASVHFTLSAPVTLVLKSRTSGISSV